MANRASTGNKQKEIVTVRATGSLKTVEDALQASHNENAGIRVRAARMLGHSNSPEAQARLLEMLEDRAEQVRNEVAEVLAATTDESVVFVLKQMAKSSPDQALRLTAAHIMDKRNGIERHLSK